MSHSPTWRTAPKKYGILCITPTPVHHSSILIVSILLYISFQVDSALAYFMNERTQACNAQAEAMKLYDAEMLHIMKEVEDEEMRNKFVFVVILHL
jgi:hypothetical protein